MKELIKKHIEENKIIIYIMCIRIILLICLLVNPDMLIIVVKIIEGLAIGLLIGRLKK